MCFSIRFYFSLWHLQKRQVESANPMIGVWEKNVSIWQTWVFVMIICQCCWLNFWLWLWRCNGFSLSGWARTISRIFEVSWHIMVSQVKSLHDSLDVTHVHVMTTTPLLSDDMLALCFHQNQKYFSRVSSCKDGQTAAYHLASCHPSNSCWCQCHLPQ